MANVLDKVQPKKQGTISATYNVQSLPVICQVGNIEFFKVCTIIYM